MELDLAYAITIHKSQDSEFEVVIIPVLTQHLKMLFRNLIYGITRARKLAVFVDTRKALAMSVKNQDISKRQTALQDLLMGLRGFCRGLGAKIRGFKKGFILIKSNSQNNASYLLFSELGLKKLKNTCQMYLQ